MSEIYRNGKRYGGGIPLPTGGTRGQALLKKSSTDGDIEWGDVAAALPDGGDAGQALVKKSSADQDVEWGDVSGETIQQETMPAASADELDHVYQFVGITDNTFTNGYFYKCVTDGTNYSWERTDVQPAGGITIDRTLVAANWNTTTKQQTVIFTGYHDSLGGVIGVPKTATKAQREAYATAKVSLISQSGTAFIFECEEIPSIDLPVTLYAGGNGGDSGSDLPAGGTTGQALIKNSNADGDVKWGAVDGLPTGGTSGQVLTKKSSTDGDAEWKDVNALPSGGTTGQALLKKSNTDGDVEWKDVEALPTGGTTGQFLKKKSSTDGDAEWSDVDALPSGGTAGQVLTKKSSTDGDVEWRDSKTVQVDALPTASADLVGTVYQYVGNSTDSYKSNYWYKCSEESAGVFAWVNVSVQDGTISRELTQAQYDALPDETKQDGTVYYVTDATPFVLDNADYGFTPIGTIISVMGNSAPRNYLVCNGQTVNIADYPELANYFETQFGSKNHFGGDGITTFAVPDLQGEFLRGAGLNSHTGQGSGANVGVHQDATEHRYVYLNERKDKSGQWIGLFAGDNSITNSDTRNNYFGTSKEDSVRKLDTTSYYISASKETLGSNASQITSRPTNTSVLYCIAYRNIYITHEHIDERNKYSETEKVIGEWIDGKPLYQKTYSLTAPSSTGDHNIADLPANFETIHISDWFLMSDDSVMTDYMGSFFVWIRYKNNPNGNKIACHITDSGLYNKPVYITIQYTKTTD